MRISPNNSITIMVLSLGDWGLGVKFVVKYYNYILAWFMYH
jgi:hypothetical protein